MEKFTELKKFFLNFIFPIGVVLHPGQVEGKKGGWWFFELEPRIECTLMYKEKDCNGNAER